MAARKKSSSPRSPRLFPSPRRIPPSIRWDCETWMCFFQDFCQTLLSSTDDGQPQDRAVNRVKLARVLADQALEEVQDRWPGVRV